MPSRVLPLLLALVLAPPAAAALALAVLRPQDAPWPFAAGLIVLAVGAVFAARHAGERGARAGLVVAGLGLLLWPELALRVTGFRFDQSVIVQFGFPRPETLMELEPDPELFWRIPAGYLGANRDGFFGPELVPKRPGRFRMVFLGDSCTMQGYPRYAGSALERMRPGRRVEALNLGVAGYSSHQGLVLARRWLPELEPDLVSVYFGWNDHWQAWGATDAERAGQTAQRVGLALLLHARVVQWVRSRVDAPPSEPLDDPRVPPEAYRANLEAIGKLAIAQGAQVLMITAPSAHEAAGVPDYLVEQGFAAGQERVLRWHADYNQVVREVAREHGWHLLDLAREAGRRAGSRRYFLEDGIHFTYAGLDWVGARVARKVATDVLAEPAPRSREAPDAGATAR